MFNVNCLVLVSTGFYTIWVTSYLQHYPSWVLIGWVEPDTIQLVLRQSVVLPSNLSPDVTIHVLTRDTPSQLYDLLVFAFSRLILTLFLRALTFAILCCMLIFINHSIG